MPANPPGGGGNTGRRVEKPAPAHTPLFPKKILSAGASA